MLKKPRVQPCATAVESIQNTENIQDFTPIYGEITGKNARYRVSRTPGKTVDQDVAGSTPVSHPKFPQNELPRMLAFGVIHLRTIYPK
jgi:hypothetical protein